MERPETDADRESTVAPEPPPDASAPAQNEGEAEAAAGPPPPGPGPGQPARADGEPPSRWTLLRDVFAFQIKLVIDGLRDVLLSPLSLIIALLGLAFGRHEWFYELLVVGRRSERWIDLFRAASRIEPEAYWPPPWHYAPPDGAAPAPGAGYYAPPPPPARWPRPPATAPDIGPDRDGEEARAQDEAAEASAARGRTGDTAGASSGWYTDTRWSEKPGGQSDVESIDDLINQVELRLREQYQRGGLTARAKHSIDRVLDTLEKQTRQSAKKRPAGKRGERRDRSR
jgi:hypothetical protein